MCVVFSWPLQTLVVVFWYVTSCNVVDLYRGFGGTCYFRFLRGKVTSTNNQLCRNSVVKQPTV